MKEEMNINQNFKTDNVGNNNEKSYMKIIDIAIGFALMVVLFISIYYHHII